MSRRSRKARLPQEAVRVSIEDLTHDGRGVARVNGKAVFIAGALPGEVVEFRYTRRHKQYDEGRLQRVLEVAADRVPAPCAHFGVCGGCSLQHLTAERQIHYKQHWLLENLARIGKVMPQQVAPPLSGPYWGYRRKARLGVKYVAKKERVLVGFREQGSPFLADLQACRVLHPRIGGLLSALAELIGGLSIYQRLPQIEVAVGDTVAALSLRVLDEPSAADKDELIAFGQQHDLGIYLQPKGPETSYALWPKQPCLDYRLPEFDVTLRFEPYDFTQINASINRRMIVQALAWLDVQAQDRVLDLFCGLGNFTLPLARRAAQVTGVEGAAALIARAEDNARANQIDNVRYYTADLAGKLSGEPWLHQTYDKILLDPPRSGASAVMPYLAPLGARRIVYVSCHPATLARDVGELVHRFGYRLEQAGVMDMFPHTAHVESMALLIAG